MPRRAFVAAVVAVALHALVALAPRVPAPVRVAITNAAPGATDRLELALLDRERPHDDAARATAPARHDAVRAPRLEETDEGVAAPAPDDARAPDDDAPTPLAEAPSSAPSYAPRRLPSASEAVAGVDLEPDPADRIRGFIAELQRDGGPGPGPTGIRLTPSIPGDAHGALEYDSAELHAVISDDGTIAIEEKPPFALGGALSGSGDPYALPTFDINGPLLRLAGEDPTAPQKSCLLDATRELRVARREQADRDRLTTSLVELHSTLLRVWRDPRASAPDRRRALFELWDECRDDAVGAQAREVIVRFVRDHLPKGSADAFTDVELARYNRQRTAAAAFQPYI